MENQEQKGGINKVVDSERKGYNNEISDWKDEIKSWGEIKTKNGSEVLVVGAVCVSRCAAHWDFSWLYAYLIDFC